MIEYVALINDSPISIECNFKLLTLHLNNSLSLSSHTNFICKKVSQVLYLFNNSRKFLSSQCTKLFYYNFIHPHIINNIALYFFTSPASTTDQIYKLQKKALRTICEVRLKDKISSSSLFKKCSILPLPLLAKYHAACMGHTALYIKTPAYLLPSFTQDQGNPTQTIATRNQHKIKSSLSYNKLERAIQSSFNSLPVQIRALTSQSYFKIKLKKHLLNSL